MTGAMRLSVGLALMLALAGPACSQETEGDSELGQRAEETVQSARETADEVAKTVDESEEAQEISAGILRPIYQMAEAIAFPAFHWFAFAAMVAGVVSFALQLTLGKLVVLSRFGFSLSEILSDALGLLVSLIGLVLTTQAAAENSQFTSSAASVLSATAVGAIVGLVFYFWGQSQELQAVEGRRHRAAVASGGGKRAAAKKAE